LNIKVLKKIKNNEGMKKKELKNVKIKKKMEVLN
tara:strand:+ start:1739 stop:1840 length:102 start_codon:yes stop_codon:yes gene_type:complete